jgi:hypothetical protein
MKPKQRTKKIPSHRTSTMVQQYNMRAAASSSKSATTRRRVVSFAIKSKRVHTHNDNTNKFVQLDQVADALFQNRLVRILGLELGLFQQSFATPHCFYINSVCIRIWKRSNLHLLDLPWKKRIPDSSATLRISPETIQSICSPTLPIPHP